MNVSSVLRSMQLYVLYGFLFLFPLFFLPLTHDAFAFQKLYLIIIATTLIIIIGLFRVVFTQKITWNAHMLSFSPFLIVLSSLVSIIISSPNKIQSLFAVPSGLVSFFFLALWSIIIIIIQSRPAKVWIVMKLSTFLLSLVVIVSFLFHVSFSPLGNYLETAVYIGFFILYVFYELMHRSYVKRKILLSLTLLVIYSVACGISVQSVLKNKLLSSIPSYGMSFDTARAILTKPATAVFGIGVDNYSALFTRSKTSSYNMTILWNTTFSHGRSFILDLWAETGLFGVALFTLFIIAVYYYCRKSTIDILTTSVLLIFLLFPSSFVVLFLFFTFVGLTLGMKHHIGKKVSLKGIYFVYSMIGAVFSFLMLFFISYILIRVYRAEYYYSYATTRIQNNRIDDAYGYLKKAVLLNPYNESYRIRFAQVYLLIAEQKAEKGKEKLSKNETHAIAQAIELGLTQAKAGVRLNPEKALNWENLGDMYALLVGSVNGADAWSVASYQRAIQLDPVRPSLRLKVGGIYYKARSYEEAQKYFQQALELKPDWPNAYYNLAYVLFQEKKYQEAIGELAKTRALIPSSSAEFKKITKELVEFKKYIK